MKIAFIVSTFPSLSETFILNQITGLIDRGHKVDIYADSSGTNSVMHEDIVKYNLLNYTTYFSGAKINNKTLGAKFYQRINTMSYILAKLPERPKSFIKALGISDCGQEESTLSLLNKTARVLSRGKYDIIHCHFGKNGILGVILKNIGAIEGKVITTFHGADMSRYIERKGNKVYNYLLENGDLFLPISERWKNELINLGCNEQKIIVHRMGVDTNKFVFTHRNLTANKKIHLLTVARLVEKKGVQYGIQAVAKAVRKYPDIEYRIVGNGPLKSEMKLLIDKLKIEDKVKLIGRKRQEDVIELMKDADILLAPSVTDNNGDQEGIPVVLMEALAQGLPVISTYHSGIPELIQDGESGYLVPERDIDALAEKLTYLIEHPDRWIKMGQEGRKYVEEYYNINKLNDRLIEIYRYLLDEDNK